MLYGCEAWTLKLDQQRRLKTTQRKMLRLILNARRREISGSSSSSQSSSSESASTQIDSIVLEPWPEFLRRTARWAEEQLEKANLKDWLAQWKIRKWRWAGRLMTTDAHKWSAAATLWNPGKHSSRPCGHKQARPRRRWDQEIAEYWRAALPGSDRAWHDLARDTSLWKHHCENFAKSFAKRRRRKSLVVEEQFLQKMTGTFGDRYSEPLQRWSKSIFQKFAGPGPT